ncbi:hypothetical protein [Kitasatospora sp. NPDC017646]|uniref:hypothetical protein n=1 Tax=Kitasatospora sp. NPDC017646 TaxID=3364024 RepID=UPI0037B31E13
MAERRHEYAPAGTLPGLLQRGRGLGALMAAENPEAAADLVYGCVRWEWRWDARIDERDVYLARLIRDLGLPLGPVVEVLSGTGNARARATRVLELLALDGSAEAREALGACARREREEAGAGAAHEAGRPDPMAELASSALLELLTDPGESEQRKVNALRVLCGREPEAGLVPLVPSLGTADGRYPLSRLPGVIRELGALAMPAARDWAASGTRWLAVEGLAVLVEHGEEQDVPTLVAELEQDWVDRAWCGPMHLARGLARFGPGAADAVSLLRRFWLQTPHSSERAAYLEALAAMGSAGMAQAYVESLWDCESGVRLLGVEHAPERPEVWERLRYLRDDPMEERAVREAAGRRLSGGGAS